MTSNMPPNAVAVFNNVLYYCIQTNCLLCTH